MADIAGFYVHAALDQLTKVACFENAQRVLEIGGGTGRFAARLLEHELPNDAQYVDMEPSATMRKLATRRLEHWQTRADVRTLQDGRIDAWIGRVDRYVATYVLNVLPDNEAIHEQLNRAHRMLSPTGLLCMVNQTYGRDGFQLAISKTWMRLYERMPNVLGNCRLIDAQRDYIDDSCWRVHYREVVCRFGFCSEVIVVGKHKGEDEKIRLSKKRRAASLERND
ncbi:MAG: class I SAM-dependent methyltransferase [Candidatus Eremiobacteraeota bacterium]|nr:class I SAM-dependent methyltransferase [Candidatus Eremiobacteraeota bacterium]